MEKYAPRNLADVLGQGDVIKSLQAFAAEPYPCAMLFHGETGVGKTATALALARALDCAPEEAEFGGLYQIPSGDQCADSVKEWMRLLHYRPMFGSGWRVLIVNECDRMSSAAEVIWMDALEALPTSSVLVFTTNEPHRLSQRFRDRCETYAFESDTKRLKPHIRRLAVRVWQEEVGTGKCPSLDRIGMPTLCGEGSFHASFRLALQQLTRFVREAKAGLDPRRTRRQLNKSVGIEQDATSTCDHCKEEQPVIMGQKKHKCRACGKTFHVEW
jgi:hypothetical protein